MAAQQIMHGARALISVNGKPSGIFSNIQWGVNYDVIPAFILGSFGPAELTYTGMEAISINCTGFRIINNGAYVAGSFPQLQELMTHQDFSISIIDRQTGKTIFTAIGCRPVSYSTGMAPKSQSDFSISYLALRSEDESSVGQNDTGAASLLPV